MKELKEEKHAELKRIMQARRNAIQVEFDGDTFDANESAQENMIVLLKAFDLGAPAVQIRSATYMPAVKPCDAPGGAGALRRILGT